FSHYNFYPSYYSTSTFNNYPWYYYSNYSSLYQYHYPASGQSHYSDSTNHVPQQNHFVATPNFTTVSNSELGEGKKVAVTDFLPSQLNGIQNSDPSFKVKEEQKVDPNGVK